jgi:MFS family permease
VKGLSLVSFFNDIASEMIYPLLPAFLTGTLGAGATLVGALDGAADLTSAALKWISGRLSDRPGWRKPLILAGYGTAVLARPLISIASAAWQVVGFRVLDRVGKGLRTAPRDALLAGATPVELHGRAFGFHRAADHAGALLGSLIAWWAVANAASVREVIGWSVVPGVVAVVVLAVVLKGHGSRVTRPSGTGPAIATPATRDSRPFGPILVLALFTLFRLPEALLLLRLQELGVPIAMIPLAWAGLHVVRSVASYPAGRLVDRLGPDIGVGLGALVFAAVLTLLGKPLPAPIAVGAFLLFGLSAACTEPAERTLVARLSPATLGRGFGVYHALTGLAALPAGLLFGWLYETSGASDALWLSGAGVGVTGLLWILTRARTAAAQ